MRPETAFQDYALAQKYEPRQEAVLAARITLRQSLTLDSRLHATYLRELCKYHERVTVRTDLRSTLRDG